MRIIPRDDAESFAEVMAALASTIPNPQERAAALEAIGKGKPVRITAGGRTARMDEVRRTVARFRKTRARRRRRAMRTARPRTPRLRGATVLIARPGSELLTEAEARAGPVEPPPGPLHIGCILPDVLAEIERRLRRRRSA